MVYPIRDCRNLRRSFVDEKLLECHRLRRQPLGFVASRCEADRYVQFYSLAT